MPRYNAIIVPVALLASACAATGSRAEAQGRLDDFMARYDMNGDEAITIEEARAERDHRFDESDADGDGYLSKAELEAMAESRPQMGARMGRGGSNGGREPDLGLLDEDGDGRLSRAEFTARDPMLITLFDRDGDAAVTRDELIQTLRERRNQSN